MFRELEIIAHPQFIWLNDSLFRIVACATSVLSSALPHSVVSSRSRPFQPSFCIYVANISALLLLLSRSSSEVSHPASAISVTAITRGRVGDLLTVVITLIVKREDPRHTRWFIGCFAARYGLNWKITRFGWGEQTTERRKGVKALGIDSRNG